MFFSSFKYIQTAVVMFVLSSIYTWKFGEADLGLAWCGLVQGDPVWHGQVWRFIYECKMTSHI